MAVLPEVVPSHRACVSGGRGNQPKSLKKWHNLQSMKRDDRENALQKINVINAGLVTAFDTLPDVPTKFDFTKDSPFLISSSDTT